VSERGEQLHAVVDAQLAELLDLVRALSPPRARLPLPGREKLGDGTVGAVAIHTAGNYRRIAVFVSGLGGHTGDSPGQHSGGFGGDAVDLPALTAMLAATRAELNRIVGLTDAELDAVPPAGSFRFADGQRNLEAVLTGLFKHQAHTVRALAGALG
jgi:hypothetical protein